MVSTVDPVGSGFVASLARPGGNITGSSSAVGDYSPKLFELIMTVVPGVSRVAVLGTEAATNLKPVLQAVRENAQKTGVAVVPAVVTSPPTPQAIAQVFDAMIKAGARAVVVAGNPAIMAHRHQIASLALKHRLPAISQYREMAAAGVLMSYGADRSENIRQTRLRGPHPQGYQTQRASRCAADAATLHHQHQDRASHRPRHFTQSNRPD
jgi:putative ABC transport system substrate-binding protein